MNTQNITLKCMPSRYLRKTFYDLPVTKQNANVIFAMQLDLFWMVFVSQHFNIKIYSLVFLVLAPRVHISAATKIIGVVCFRKVTLCTVVKCSLRTQWCLSKVNLYMLYMFMQGTSSSLMLHDGDHSWHLADDLFHSEIETFLGVGKNEGWIWRVFMCLSESICLTMKNQFWRKICEAFLQNDSTNRTKTSSCSSVILVS